MLGIRNQKIGIGQVSHCQSFPIKFTYRVNRSGLLIFYETNITYFLIILSNFRTSLLCNRFQWKRWNFFRWRCLKLWKISVFRVGKWISDWRKRYFILNLNFFAKSNPFNIHSCCNATFWVQLNAWARCWSVPNIWHCFLSKILYCAPLASA